MINKLLDELYWAELDSHLSKVFNQVSPLYFGYLKKRCPTEIDKKKNIVYNISESLLRSYWHTTDMSGDEFTYVALNKEEALALMQEEIELLKERLMIYIRDGTTTLTQDEIKEISKHTNLEVIYQIVLKDVFRIF